MAAEKEEAYGRWDASFDKRSGPAREAYQCQQVARTGAEAEKPELAYA